MKIGLFEGGLPNCAHDAGSTAVVELCTLALSAGHQLEYIYTGDNSWGRTDDLTNNKIPFRQIATKDNDVKLAFLQNEKFDVAIISRPGTTTEWFYVCEKAGVPVIYFGHDIHYARLKLGNKILPAEKQTSDREIKIMQTLEHNIWKRSAAVLYPSKQESDFINAYCNKKHAFEMPIYDMEEACGSFYANSQKPQKNNNSLMFVGGAHHMPNSDAMIWFAQEVLPNIRKDITLSVIGDWPESIRKEINGLWNNKAGAGQKIEFCGRLLQDELYNKYRSSALVIAPLRFGAGVKRKVVESVAFRCPILSTEIGFEGLDVPENLHSELLSEINAESYAGKINKLLDGGAELLLKKFEKFSDDIVAKYSKENRKKILEKSFALL